MGEEEGFSFAVTRFPDILVFGGCIAALETGTKDEAESIAIVFVSIFWFGILVVNGGLDGWEMSPRHLFAVAGRYLQRPGPKCTF